MPILFRHKGFRVYFYSQEGEPREPIHVHVNNDRKRAKYWVEPEVSLEYADRMNVSERKQMERFIHEHRQEIIDAWNEHFGIRIHRPEGVD